MTAEDELIGITEHALAEVAWNAFDKSDKPAPYNQMRDAIRALLDSGEVVLASHHEAITEENRLLREALVEVIDAALNKHKHRTWLENASPEHHVAQAAHFELWDALYYIKQALASTEGGSHE